jgi:hypothetical protein
MGGEKLSKYQERKAALAALERMHTPADTDAQSRRLGVKVLRPPPTRAPEPPRLTAGAAELAREIRRGTYTPREGAFFEAAKRGTL